MATPATGAPRISQPVIIDFTTPLAKQITSLAQAFFEDRKRLVQKAKLDIIKDDIASYGDPSKSNPASKVLVGATLLDPEFHSIKCSDQVSEVAWHIERTIRTGTFDDDESIKGQLESLFSLWTSACSLKQLDRFLSWGQEPLSEPPNEDGSNLELASVNRRRQATPKIEFLLRRLTVAFLHLPGAVELEARDPANPGAPQRFVTPLVDSLKNLYFTARGLLAQEFQRLVLDDKDDYGHDPKMDSIRWISTSRKNIAAALESVAIMACNRPIPTDDQIDEQFRCWRARNRGPMSEDSIETIRQTLRNPSVGEKLDKNFEEQGPLFLDMLLRQMEERLTDENDLDPLILDLLRREDEFEVKLAVEHYEDKQVKLVSKQFSLLDEKSFTEERAWSPFSTIDTFNNIFGMKNDNAKLPFRYHEDVVFKYFQDMGLVNRHRRNFRLLRDWIGKRPWKQIYQLYDSTNSAEPTWVDNGIHQFRCKAILPFERDEKSAALPFSHAHNIVPKLFGFFPIDVSSYHKPDYNGCDFRKDKCALCQKAYYQGRNENVKGFGSTIMELHCKSAHRFHLKCIFNFWDARGKYLHSCPTCGDMAKLNYETVGLNPADGLFLHNNQGYQTAARVAPYLYSDHPVLAKKARELYDVPAVPLIPRQAGEDEMDLDLFPDPPNTAPGRAYYESELKHIVGRDELPVFWRRHDIPAGEPARVRRGASRLVIGTHDDGMRLSERARDNLMVNVRNRFAQEQADKIAKTTGEMYLKQRFDAGRTDVYDVSQKRTLPEARVAPAMEAALFRGQRRRREYMRRKEMRDRRKGLSGLGL